MLVIHFAQVDRLLDDAGVQALVGEMLEAGAASARRLAPVDTGALKASIRVEQDGSQGTYGTDQHYAGYVEYGTSKMAAQPYLRPSVDAMIRAAK